MGMYSQGNAFSQKIIMGTFLALILNFSTVRHGGGASLFYIIKKVYLGVLEKGGGGGYPQAPLEGLPSEARF